jgi:steroid delta-isomerase-like uncharacterized protein
VSPKQLVQEWIACFNAADVDGLASLYAPDATNHQVVMAPLLGREAIRHMFRTEFDRAEMTCILENLFEDGEWAILEWEGGGTWRGEFAGRPPNGRTFVIQGCGFFRVVGGRIEFQRGYWDKVSWFGQLGIPV